MSSDIYLKLTTSSPNAEDGAPRNGGAIVKRLTYPLEQEWHCAINRHHKVQRQAGKDWGEASFMYEAKRMADEVPRMVVLFKQERDSALPQVHQQCSAQAPVSVKGNHLSCCLGVKARECPHLLALDKIERCTPDDVDTAKAWTCAAHIVSQGGDLMGEGYMLRVDDRMFWDSVYASLSQSGDAPEPGGA